MERRELAPDAFPAMGCGMPGNGAAGRARTPVCDVTAPELAPIVCFSGGRLARMMVLLNEAQDGGSAGGGGRLNIAGRPVCCPCPDCGMPPCASCP